MASSNQAVLCRYRYDPLDRLASSSPVGQADLQRFYQKNRLATEIQGTMRRTVFQHDDLLLAQQRRVEGVLETTLLATDQQRSVLQLVDKAGTEPIAYSPYGHHPAESGLASLLGFNGERRDPVTGHYLLGNGYRAYNPVLMRFNSPDSLSPFGEGGLNAYGYVGGDPVGCVDTSGHVPMFKPFLSGRALITGGIYCLITLFLLHPHVIELYWDLKRGARAMVFTPQRLHLVTVREQLLSKQ